jgi:thioredoxin 1
MKPVITLFSAIWCSACKQMAGDWSRLEHEYGDRVEFRVIDVDLDRKTAIQYNVQTLPTVTVEGREDIALRLEGLQRYHGLKRALDRLLTRVLV